MTREKLLAGPSHPTDIAIATLLLDAMDGPVALNVELVERPDGYNQLWLIRDGARIAVAIDDRASKTAAAVKAAVALEPAGPAIHLVG